MKSFRTQDQAEAYLKNLAETKGIDRYFIDCGSNRKQNNVLVLIKEDCDGSPVETIEVVEY